FCNRSVMAGRARLSSARRAAIDGVRRRAEDRRALPPAVTESLRHYSFFPFDSCRRVLSYYARNVPRKLGHQPVTANKRLKKNYGIRTTSAPLSQKCAGAAHRRADNGNSSR